MRTSASSLGAIVVVGLLACGGEPKPAPVDSAALVTTPVSEAAGKFALDDFRRLRWLHGRWQGFMPDGKKFYEQYRVLNDSTIAMHGFADSTFARATDSSRVQLRGGTVANEGRSARWVATRLDSSGADFAPERGATNHFTWTREDSTKWNASLRWTDAQGRPQNVMYALRKFGR